MAQRWPRDLCSRDFIRQNSQLQCFRARFAWQPSFPIDWFARTYAAREGVTTRVCAYHDAMNEQAQKSSSTDSAELATVAEALKARRLILLLGQDVVDTFIPRTFAAIMRRLHVGDGQGLYDWWLTTTERFETRVSALRELSDHAVLPESLITAARIPWSAVLTSAVDSVLRKALEGHPSRQIQPLQTSDFRLQTSDF
jgi:hypothetical protein